MSFPMYNSGARKGQQRGDYTFSAVPRTSTSSPPSSKLSQATRPSKRSEPRRYALGTFTNASNKTLTSSLSSGSNTTPPNDFKSWGQYGAEPEPDDYLHNPEPIKGREGSGTMFTARGCLNIGTLLILGLALIALFAGYPIIAEVERKIASDRGGFNLGGINATGQIPSLRVNRDLIDPDTPESVKVRRSFDGSNKRMNLVFSDEFNRDGRSFYPGNDPFWTAVDLHYWGTGNYEWYNPSAITTSDGNLVITLEETPDHGLNFRGGMLQSWNQFCFTGGYIEVRAVLAGAPDISGLWPAAWTMGNLGRAGYGATTDGMWPYTYDSCDVGTLPNQTFPQGGPIAAETTGVFVDVFGPGLSYLPGQRLSRCTCTNSDDHPGPKHSDGSWVGRSAPEIDIIEAAATRVPGERGHVSMSAQIAPFDAGYNLSTVAGGYEFYNTVHDAELNSYTGAVYQQAASGLVYTDRQAYELTGGQYDTYGYEYKPGSDSDAYILWTVSGEPVWRLNAAAMGPDTRTEIGQRPIPYEPMYIILNLGISSSFVYVDWDQLTFPTRMLVDYVRVWQPEGEENVGCDPDDMPTAAYIEKHAEAYWNNNLTTWIEPRARGGYDQAFPGNRLLNQC